MTDQFVAKAKMGAPGHVPQRGADKMIKNPGQQLADGNDE
jgi:hypothetical protein